MGQLGLCSIKSILLSSVCTNKGPLLGREDFLSDLSVFMPFS